MVFAKNLLFSSCYFIIFMPFFSHSSAWLVEKGKYKIISQIEFKKFHEVTKNYDKDYTQAETNYLKLSIDYGLSERYNLLGEINFSKLHSYKYIFTHNQENYIQSKKSKRFFAFPNKFDSASFGIRKKILKNKLFVMSNDLKLVILPDEKLQLNYKIAAGTNFIIKNRNFFTQAEYYFNFNPIFHNYDNKFALAIGYKKSPKKTYILSFENYFKKNYYNKLFNQKVKLPKEFNETRVQFASITYINKKASFQKAIFTTINQEKSFSSSGIILGIWFNL